MVREDLPDASHSGVPRSSTVLKVGAKSQRRVRVQVKISPWCGAECLPGFQILERTSDYLDNLEFQPWAALQVRCMTTLEPGFPVDYVAALPSLKSLVGEA